MALMIRDGQSLAEASATLFKDILLGSENNDTYNKHIILQDSPNRIKRSSDYPLLPPASSMFEEIPAHLFKHQKSADLKIYCHSDQKLIHHNNFLRSNSPLSSLWTNWDDISNNKGEKVICGVPGLATSIYMKRSKLKSLESNKEEWPNLWKKSLPSEKFDCATQVVSGRMQTTLSRVQIFEKVSYHTYTEQIRDKLVYQLNFSTLFSTFEALLPNFRISANLLGEILKITVVPTGDKIGQQFKKTHPKVSRIKHPSPQSRMEASILHFGPFITRNESQQMYSLWNNISVMRDDSLSP
ncbi:unnamed protein product [Lepeophtheirus salmonis]|uniref:(salmon louse) hypothetical protein n=1 Tax=Lepeophtheirus salmonis TaxID=72036 RepID=A0A817F9A3_LEPSM|nr:unnamed protein product [Lepeophtheirus salmonis]CAG9475320.1 unnamed protein product [Lepeophtheirus salmonis]